MSFIYEALKRAEDENERGAVTVQTVARPIFFASRPRWWVWVLLGVLGANAVLLVTLLVSRSARVSAPAPVTTMKVEPEVKTQPSAPVVERRAETRRPAPGVGRVPASSTSRGTPGRPAPPPVAAAAPAPASVPTPVPPSPPASASAAAVSPQPPAPPAPAAPAPVSSPRAPTPASPTAPASATPSVVAPAPAAPTTPSRPPESSTPGPAPSSSRPPATAAQSGSQLTLQVHVYSDVPAQRMVFINGRRYGEGDTIEGGAVLERITPDGAIVNQHGQRFAISDRP